MVVVRLFTTGKNPLKCAFVAHINIMALKRMVILDVLGLDMGASQSKYFYL